MQNSKIEILLIEDSQPEAEIQRLASFPLMNPNPVLEVGPDGQITFQSGYVMTIGRCRINDTALEAL